MEQQKQALQVKSTSFKTNAKRYGLLAATAATMSGAMSGAHAAGEIDVTPVVTTITNGVTTVSAIGLAVLSLVVVIKVFKWARSAM